MEDRSCYIDLFRYSRKIFNSTEDAEDALHDVYLQMLEDAEKDACGVPDNRTEAIPYLKTVLKNAFLMKQRKAGVKITKEVNEDAQHLAYEPKEGRVERYCNALDKLSELVTKRVSLTEQQRKLWELMMSCANTEQISKEMGVSKKNLYSQRNKLATKIRQNVKHSELYI